MDNLQVIALIVIALLILAVIIAYRKRLAVLLEFFGIKLNIEAENEPRQEVASSAAAPLAPDSSPAGVRLKKAKTTGGVLIEEGRSQTGSGIDVEDVEAGKEGITIGKGESGAPKNNPPA
jgi:hypothetical protein